MSQTFLIIRRNERDIIKNVYLSHTAAHVVLFPLLLRVPWYQAPWPTSTQGFSDPIRLLFRRGGERAESKFSYTVAVIFVSIHALITQLSSTYYSTIKFSTSLGYTSTWSRTPLRGIIYATSTTPMKLASPATIDTEARRSSWEDANNVVEREDDERRLSTLYESQYYECLGEM